MRNTSAPAKGFGAWQAGGTQTKEARRAGACALRMADLEKEAKKTVDNATRGKKTGGAKAENEARKAAKQLT